MDFYGKWLVETEWLAKHLEAPDIVILDGTFFLPIEERDALEEFREQHIPGALRFDIDEIADTSTGLPHMLPSPEKFSSRVRKMGIGDGTRVIVYDTQNIYSAARVWWMFRVMGHDDVAILNGGLCKWRAERRHMAAGEPAQRDRAPFHRAAQFRSGARPRRHEAATCHGSDADRGRARTPGVLPEPSRSRATCPGLGAFRDRRICRLCG